MEGEGGTTREVRKLVGGSYIVLEFELKAYTLSHTASPLL
jgi:hypothetical protein